MGFRPSEQKGLWVKLLWLHMMGDPQSRRKSVVQLEKMLLRHRDNHEVLIWDIHAGSPRWLREVKWDGIFLGPSFLWSRFAEGLPMKKKFEWVSDSQATKVALPQDEYDSPRVLDNWLSEWGVNLLVSIFPDHSDVLYPKLKSGKTRFIKGFTGFVSENMIEAAGRNLSKPRGIDIFYRAHTISPRYGELGRLKEEIARQVTTSSEQSESHLTIDISTRLEDTLLGASWYEKLVDSRYTLSVPSGSSLIDLFGNLGHALSTNPELSPEHMLSVDGVISRELAALSPRHLEAAVFETAQIALEGSYEGALTPGTNALLLNRDFSNVEDVIETLRDETLRQEIALGAKESVLSNPLFRSENFSRNLVELISENRVGWPSRDSSDTQWPKTFKKATREQSRAWNVTYFRRTLGRVARKLKLIPAK